MAETGRVMNTALTAEDRRTGEGGSGGADWSPLYDPFGLSGLAAKAGDWLAGGPQKRRRTRAAWDAAVAARSELADVQARTAAELMGLSAETDGVSGGLVSPGLQAAAAPGRSPGWAMLAALGAFGLVAFWPRGRA